MTVGQQEQEKILKTLQRATLFLTKIAHRGSASATAEDLKTLKNIIEALRYWHLKRLSSVLGRLRSALVAGEGDEADGKGTGREVSEAITEAIFTCKAVKTYFRGRLDDARIYEELSGKKWKENELEVLEGLKLIKVGEERWQGDTKNATLREFYLAPSEGILYRTDKPIDPLVAPVKSHSDTRAAQIIAVEKALLVPDFPPQRLIFKDSYTEPLTNELCDQIMTHVPSSFSMLVTRYKGFRSNVFAPTDFYTMLAFNSAYSTLRDLYLVDSENAMLRLDLSFADGAQARFRHHLIYGRFEAIFGRLTVQGPDPVMVPLSVFHHDDRPPFIFLGRDLAP